MSTQAFIKAISYYLPEKVLTNEDLIQEFPEWTAQKVADKIGVQKRHIAAKDETSGDMAVKAGKILMHEYKIEPNELDFVILCTQSPDYFLPTTACVVQHELGIPVSAGALDINLGCSGFVYGLALAKGLLAGNIAKNVLLLTSETYSKYMHQRDKGNRTIFGDAAAATLISTKGYAEIGNFGLGTDGSGAGNLIVRTGGLRHPEKLNDLEFIEGNPVSSDHLFMEGSEIFNFTLAAVPVLVEDTLKKNDLLQSEVDLFVFHQANKYLLNFLRKKTGIEEDKFLYYMQEVGNTVSSTIPIVLYEALHNQQITDGQKVLIAGFGVGYSWGGTLLTYKL